MCGKGMCMCVNVSVYVYIHNYMHVCICMYICAVELLSGPSLACLNVIIWAKFVFFNSVCQKRYKHGFQL